MSKSQDRHKTHKISLILALVLSAFFAAAGIAGYQHTQDLLQLGVFLALSAVAFVVVRLVFYGVDRLLDSLDQDPSDRP
ncbi:hypothetical protein [Nitrincola tapanii]|uniref:Uncharacterized protein n=1 Tax=Nitrincola tapanii TaxID=1708751 RepID=A0A5A9W5V9_9GAMM|nr:hypothetical protein [Nitrincola tapanii]KAA0875834.1 hypothetical protein E1H14_03885 [Nitrincola tapanii]